MRAKATKATAAQQMARRAERLLAGTEASAGRRQGRPGAVPDPGTVRADPADRRRAVQVVRVAGGVHRRRPGRRPRLPGGRARPQRRRQDHPAAAAGRAGAAGHRRGGARARAAARLLRAGARDARRRRGRCSRTCARPRRTSTDGELRRVLGAFLFSGESVDQPAGTLSGGEKTRLALAALVVSGGQRAAAGRADQQPRPGLPGAGADALDTYAGAVVLVTHDEGAVRRSSRRR